MPSPVDVVVIGGGQSGLAVGYHLRRHDRVTSDADRRLSFVILDSQRGPGGAWQEAWDSLHLFSPASYSSLAGWPMPPWRGAGNPDAAHVVRYLAAYEDRYDLPVERPVDVVAVHRDTDREFGRESDREPGCESGRESDVVSRRGRFVVTAADGRAWSARWVVNATGTWSRPFWPHVPGMTEFVGRQLHTADYRGARAFAGARVLVVGGGNSGAQIAADLLPVATSVTWATKTPPRMLPDDVDGRVLFETATRAVRDRAAGITNDGVATLGDIVAVPAVRRARDEHGLHAEPMPLRLVPDGAEWPDGRRRPYDSVIWCTGFRPALRHLTPLRLTTRRGRPSTTVPARRGTSASRPPSPVVSIDDPRVLFVGYGDWCGPASATLIGVNRAAKEAAATIAAEAP